jgi:S-formylglutathione hydrolase FrmB
MMKNLSRGFVIALNLLLLVQMASAAKVDTVETYSDAMHKKIKAVIIRPNDYDRLAAMPVVYLLHGYGGKYSDWINNVSAIKDIADQDQMMIVCVDGNVSSWYLDSPVNPDWKYETYVATELITWVDSHYKTIKDRSGRAITGLSMGGHGGLYLSFKHQDVFGAGGATSGGVDIRPFPNNWKIAEKLGTLADKPDNWDKNTVVNLVDLLSPGKLNIIFDCGVDDFFYKVNVNLHELLAARKIPHDFISRPGAHTWAYWKNSIKYQLLYFHEYFEAQAQKLNKR